MALRVKKRYTIIVKATCSQVAYWESYGRMYRRDVPAFLAFAGDLFARYLRDALRERSRPDPVFFRREEKRRLEALVRAAKGLYQHLPAPFFSPISGERRDPGKDLRVAVEAVESFWEDNGEAYGI